MSTRRSFVREMARRSFQRLQGAVEYFLKPELRDSWGGPLNGQLHRQLMVRQIVANIAPDYILETGTYRGTSTEFFSTLSRARVLTVESNPHYFGYSRMRLLFHTRVATSQADSRSFLQDFMASGRYASSQIFVYLDAHWGGRITFARRG